MSFLRADRHSSTESREPCPYCGTVGISGRRCLNPLCGRELPINVAQVFADPFLDAGGEIGRATGKMAGATRDAAGAIGSAIAGDAKIGAVAAAAGIGAAFALGGFWTGMSALVGTYIGLIGSPSVVAFFVNSKILLGTITLFGAIIGALIGLIVTFKIGLALKERETSRLWLFVPLAIAATWLTLRIPDAFSRWWEATPWW